MFPLVHLFSGMIVLQTCSDPYGRADPYNMHGFLNFRFLTCSLCQLLVLISDSLFPGSSLTHFRGPSLPSEL